MDRQAFFTSLERQWATDHRWDGIRRPYGAGAVYRLRGSIDIEYSLARHGAARLWQLFFFFQAEDGIRDLTVTGVQTCALPISQVTPKVGPDTVFVPYSFGGW